MKQELLEKYAELIAKSGANVKKGQYVLIRLSPDVEKFAALVAKECYKLGAERVCYEGRSSDLEKGDNAYGTSEGFGKLTAYDYGFQKFQTEYLPCLIWIDCEDPDGLSGFDAKKVASV